MLFSRTQTKEKILLLGIIIASLAIAVYFFQQAVVQNSAQDYTEESTESDINYDEFTEFSPSTVPLSVDERMQIIESLQSNEVQTIALENEDVYVYVESEGSYSENEDDAYEPPEDNADESSMSVDERMSLLESL